MGRRGHRVLCLEELRKRFELGTGKPPSTRTRVPGGPHRVGTPSDFGELDAALHLLFLLVSATRAAELHPIQRDLVQVAHCCLLVGDLSWTPPHVKHLWCGAVNTL